MAGVEPVYVCFSVEGAPSAYREYVSASRDAPNKPCPAQVSVAVVRTPCGELVQKPVGFFIFKPGLYATAVRMRGMLHSAHHRQGMRNDSWQASHPRKFAKQYC